jgi:hypothetical protein
MWPLDSFKKEKKIDLNDKEKTSKGKRKEPFKGNTKRRKEQEKKYQFR